MIGLAVMGLVAVALAVAVLASRSGGGPVRDSGSRVDGSPRGAGSRETSSESDHPDAPPTISPLGRRLRELSDEGVLTPEQAAQLQQLAHDDGVPAGGAAGDSTTLRTGGPADHHRAATANLGVLDVLGYLGGALLLGALIFVGFTLWGDLSRGARTMLAIASFVVPAAGGAILERTSTRRGLARVLLALSSFAAGFACFVIIDDEDLMISAGVVVLTAVVGLLTLRSVAFYLPGWVGAMAFVPAFVQNGLELPEGDALGYAIAAGFLVVGLALVVAGMLLGREVAWTLAGLSGWAATLPLVGFDHSYLALAVATAVAGALFVGVVRLKEYAFAIVGCLIVLSMWPVALYQILDTALGVALGLVAAGCVLILSAVVLARRRHGWSQTDSNP
ncbi:MAG TPA: hypothetical protein VFR88_00260 [Microlunatus sp.]|nr:hypothetical protein [Microlunatus sp.]